MNFPITRQLTTVQDQLVVNHDVLEDDVHSAFVNPSSNPPCATDMVGLLGRPLFVTLIVKDVSFDAADLNGTSRS
ncbi:hypothetical protein AZE42_01916 [Rhizopogon vesiculosus]|uniref:Uncharacterized protein n=1 Tax=Rhizopogon vesiculosus TaxID=180088 RepID=A0A1J8RHV1_9AGAM|nr:hypothetical protein AZE42_01916 [Rhizopogon vesiculosus]